VGSAGVGGQQPDTAMNLRSINSAGLALVKHFESCFLEAYWDKTGKCWTIGWGHTGLRHNDGTVYKGRQITEDTAADLLAHDMHQFEQRVLEHISVPLTDDQFSALVSFDFNTGGLTLRNGKPSTLTRRLNTGDYFGAALEFLKWDKSGGVRLKGLTRRRLSEQRLFRSQHPAIITKL
jgi:lysozyme